MRLFNQLKWYFIKKWKNYLGAVMLLIIIAILQLVPPKIIGILIDCIIKKKINNQEMLPWIYTIILVSIIVYILRYLWRVLLFSAAYKLATELRVQFYSCLTKKRQDFFLKNRTGDLIARATNDVDRVVFAAGEGVLTLIDSLVMGISVLIVMMTQINFLLTIISLIPMPIMAILIKKYGNQLHKKFSQSQSAFSLLNNRTQEILTNIRMIKAFGLEKKQSEKFYEAVQHAGKKNMEVAIIDSCFDPVIYIAVAFSNLLAIVGGSWLVWKKIITVGHLTSFVMYLGLMIWPMLALAWMFNIVERGSAALERISDITEKKINKKHTETFLSQKKHILKIKICTFYYPKSHYPNLKNINISIPPGKMLGICGPTGSGKSTLLKIIQCQFSIHKGEIFYNSIPLSKLNINQWRNRIAVVNQNIFLFSDTIAKNIALGNPKASQKNIETAAKIAHLHEDIIHFSQGYNTQVGEKGLSLSGGQKQRLSIARALLLNREILIFDDSLSAVDRKTEYKILQNIHLWKENKHTLIITAHRLATLRNADEIIVIKNGSIIQRGTNNSLMKEENWYKNTKKYQKLKKIF